MNRHYPNYCEPNAWDSQCLPVHRIYLSSNILSWKDVANELIENGADVNAATKDGYTTLAVVAESQGMIHGY